MTALTLVMLFGLSNNAMATFGPAQAFTEPTPVAQDMFGINTSILSGDGQTALVGASGATVGGKSGAGLVYVYTHTSGTWAFETTISNPAPEAAAQFGRATALSQNGTVALIGARGGSGPGYSTVGAAYVFTLKNGQWTKTATIADPDNSAGDAFGAQVALSNDGTTALVSSLGVSGGAGAVFVFKDSGGTWSKVASLPYPGKVSLANFGVNVALSGDGTQALVGTLSGGAWYAFSNASGTWELNQTFTGSVNQDFGVSVGISGDGLTAFAGCPYCNTSGTVTVYTNTAGTWMQSATIKDPYPSAQTGDLFGYALSSNTNGSEVLIGSGTNGQKGMAFLFNLTSGAWTNTQQLNDPAATKGDDFSFNSVSIAGDGSTAFIGAPNTTVAGKNIAGAAYGYTASSVSVDLGVTLTALPNPATSGQAVALDATVTNHSTTTAATNIKLVFTLANGTAYQSASPAGGNCSLSGLTLTCTLANLAANGTWQPSFTVSFTSAESYKEEAKVSADQPDPDSGNNAATETLTVNASGNGSGNGNSGSGSGNSGSSHSGSSSGKSGGGALGLLSLGLLGLFLGRQRRRIHSAQR